jgi:uncharacterized membrane protein (DUF2068 family)
MTAAPESFLSVPRISTTESTFVRVIAIFKLVKCVLFICSALAISRIVRLGVDDAVASWLAVLHIDPQSHWLQWLLAKASGVSHDTFRLVAAGSFLYAAIYLIEGIGLWLDRPWAEWLTIVGSLCLVPVEIYEIYERVTPVRIGILVINLIIVAFLIHHVRLKRRIAKATVKSHEPEPVI